MNISLTPELERLVAGKVNSGMYKTSSEVIREGLRLLKERDERLQSLRGDIRAGFEAVGRGEFTDYDKSNVQELAERVETRGRKRLAREVRTAGTRNHAPLPAPPRPEGARHPAPSRGSKARH